MNNAIALTSLCLNVVTLSILKTKGVVRSEEIKTSIDMATLLLEESGLILGEEGKAVHENLEAILAIFSGDALQTKP